jgi:hypothetical protein
MSDDDAMSGEFADNVAEAHGVHPMESGVVDETYEAPHVSLVDAADAEDLHSRVPGRDDGGPDDNGADKHRIPSEEDPAPAIDSLTVPAKPSSIDAEIASVYVRGRGKGT